MRALLPRSRQRRRFARPWPRALRVCNKRSCRQAEAEHQAPGFVVTAQDRLFNLISVKLTGQQIPETLSASDRLWTATGSHDPINRVFLDEQIQIMYLAMHRWLQEFAYRVDLAVWLFPAAAGLALLIALLTVSTHSILVARAKPVAALRYE
jgi:hypothetical protein